MGKFLVFTVLITIIAAATWLALPLMLSESVPELDANEWWGPNDLKGKVDASIKPFQVKFTDEMIKDLKTRLQNKRQLVPPLEGVGFEYGFNTKQIDVWVKYWSEEYKFSEREKFFNKFPQYKTNIQGLDIHFVRVKPKVNPGITVVPLLLLHGWPCSFRDFYEAIPLLTKQDGKYNFTFEVIVPSLPGFGFSDAAVRPGLGTAQIGVIFKNLMNRLGHKTFYIQGGDWGSVIASNMATMFQNDILGYHSNMLFVPNNYAIIKTVLGSFFPSLIMDSQLVDRMYPLWKFFSILIEEFGYFHLQATKPDTFGVALSDSPSGLLSYILEKFSLWTCDQHRVLVDGGLSYYFSKDKLLDNIMVYWITNSITTSMRLYAEDMSHKNQALDLPRQTTVLLQWYSTSVPTWALQAKNEFFYQPPIILKTKYVNLLGVTTLNEGGHFIALEMPQVFADDLFNAVKFFKEYHQIKTEL
ncbi:unnamed protein product [Euphydryas editha]|uniref:Epoxide hydrolase n=1 Tax=Euphydryas editha TaxID=104508 RepID=A0AAU9UJI6_EUPED|nr:unnamed protein product [Euphydryas editha]